MRVCVVAATCTITGFFLLGCSLATSWNDLPLGPLDAPDAAKIDAGKTVIDSGPTVVDSGSDAADASVDTSACPVGEYVCGGDPNGGPDKDTLYSCPMGGMPASAVTVCTHGCVTRLPHGTDVCQCTVDGNYCGNDQIPGDPNTLYRCNPDFTGTLVMKCVNGCEVNKVGKDDACK